MVARFALVLALDGLGPLPDADYMFSDGYGANKESIDPSFNYHSNNDSWQDMVPSFRQMVEAQAAADSRCSSNKEKRIEVSLDDDFETPLTTTN